MALPSLIEKLQDALNKESFVESDAVYILSRIRKLLELNHQKNKYKVLYFYCNWALHSEIHDTDSIKEVLINLEKDINAHIDFVTHKPFKEDLKKFLKEYNLVTKITTSSPVLRNFSSILQKIYSDTPLYVMTGRENLKITISDTGINNTYKLIIDKLSR